VSSNENPPITSLPALDGCEGDLLLKVEKIVEAQFRKIGCNLW